MWGILWGVVAITSPDPEQIVKALRFQYEAQIKELRVENARLQSEMASRENLLNVCGAANQQLRRELTELSETIPTSSEAEAASPPSEFAVEIPDYDDDDRLYKRALSLFEQRQYNQAILTFERIVREFPQSGFADNALFMMARTYLEKGEAQLAELEYLRLLEQYPKSERRAEAIRQLQSMDEALAQARRVKELQQVQLKDTQSSDKQKESQE